MTIRNRVHHPRIQPLNNILPFFSTSCIGGFNLFWRSILGLQSSSSWILSVQVPGGIQMMSAMVQPIAFLNLFMTFTIAFTCSPLRSTAKITGSVLLAPRKTYLKWPHNCFYSSI
uniref:Putative ovule protein n=1 Tax=Solanum chacoense TaxID=4108 RepID=A0A0V0HQ85_SOLCH